MPEEEPIERAREDERQGLSPSTQAGEFVREEMEHIREGEHGARSPEQAIAIGLSKARRAGVKLPPPKRGKARTKRQAKRDLAKGRRPKKPSRRRSRAVRGALDVLDRGQLSDRTTADGQPDLEGIWTNREATGMKAVPRRLLVLGGDQVYPSASRTESRDFGSARRSASAATISAR